MRQVDQLQLVLASAKVNIPSLVDRITLIVSIVLLWIILAQIRLVLAARVYLKTDQMVWDFKHEKLPGEEGIIEVSASPDT